VCDASNRLFARLERAKVADAIVDTGEHLMPLLNRLDVYRAQVRKALFLQIPHEPTADESAGSAHENGIAP
jgi:hypothetical protein